MSLQVPHSFSKSDAKALSFERQVRQDPDRARSCEMQLPTIPERTNGVSGKPFAPSQIKVRRIGPSAQGRPAEPGQTRFTKDHPATWFSI